MLRRQMKLYEHEEDNLPIDNFPRSYKKSLGTHKCGEQTAHSGIMKEKNVFLVSDHAQVTGDRTKPFASSQRQRLPL